VGRPPTQPAPAKGDQSLVAENARLHTKIAVLEKESAGHIRRADVKCFKQAVNDLLDERQANESEEEKSRAKTLGLVVNSDMTAAERAAVGAVHRASKITDSFIVALWEKIPDVWKRVESCFFSGWHKYNTQVDTDKFATLVQNELGLTVSAEDQVLVMADQLCWDRISQSRARGHQPALKLFPVIVSFHLFWNFLKGCVFKHYYWGGGLSFLILQVLKRSRVTEECKNWAAADEALFHVSNGAYLAFFRAFLRSEEHAALPNKCGFKEGMRAMMAFYRRGRATDAVFK